MTTDPQRSTLVNVVLVTLVLAVTHAAMALLPGVFQPLASQATDRLFALRARFPSLQPSYDGTVVHVAIDDRSLREGETFYLGRPEHARLVDNLGRAGVVAQLHDVIFAHPQEPAADLELIEASAGAGGVFYGMAAGMMLTDAAVAEPGPEVEAVLRASRWHPGRVADPSSIPAAKRPMVTFPALSLATGGLGFLDLRVDRDGVYRRAPLLARDGDGFLPSLPLRVICDYLEVTPDRVEVTPGRSIVLRGARRPQESEGHDIVIPIDQYGNMVVNYLGRWGSMTQYPFDVVYEASDDRFMMEDLQEELQGKIAVVSWVATGAGDIGSVPVEPQFPFSGIHANVMNSILSGEFLREAGPWTVLWAVELPMLALLVLAARRFRTIALVLFPPLLALLHMAVAALLFLHFRWIIDIPGPIIVLAGSTLVVVAHQYHREAQARAVLRSTFDAYFPSAIVDKVMRHSSELITAAQKRELTILFSDIREFSRHTSTMEATDVRRLLNEYFEEMIDIVFEHRGTLDKFIGDGLMVFFGDPEPQSDHARRAVQAAIEMQQSARKLARRWAARGDMPLEIRVGINTGEVIVGNMGSNRRVSYTVLGEPVNLAQRLESAAEPGGILVSARTAELLGDDIELHARPSIRVKGFDRPIEVYDIAVTADEPKGAADSRSNKAETRS